MGILITILLTWYITKLYYTGRIFLDIHPHRDEIKVVCVKCSRHSWIDKDHLRSPYYCNDCK